MWLPKASILNNLNVFRAFPRSTSFKTLKARATDLSDNRKPFGWLSYQSLLNYDAGSLCGWLIVGKFRTVDESSLPDTECFSNCNRRRHFLVHLTGFRRIRAIKMLHSRCFILDALCCFSSRTRR